MAWNILVWTALGIIAGFLVYLIFPGQRRYLAGTVSAGIVGAFVGGIVYSALKIGSIAYELDPLASLVAVFGSVFLIYLIRLLIKTEDKKNIVEN